MSTALSRRRLVGGAVWSAPVIVVASAVPAHAVSPGGGALVVRPGTTGVAVADVDGVGYYDLVVSGLSLLVPGGAGAGELTLTATFVPETAGGPADLEVYGSPDGWAITPDQGAAASVSMVRAAAVAPGDEVAFPDGDYFGTAAPAADQPGVFLLTATAPGHTAASAAFATDDAPQPVRGRVRRYARPV